MHRFPNGRRARRAARCTGTCSASIARCSPGCATIARTGPLHGIGIDSWAVDYGLLDRDGELLGNPYSHRDRRTDGIAARVLRRRRRPRSCTPSPACSCCRSTPFPAGGRARHAPRSVPPRRCCCFRTSSATGSPARSAPSARTRRPPACYDVTTRTWSHELAERLGLPWSVLPPLRDPGAVVGPLLPEVAADLGVTSDVPVIGVGSHDTASAVVGGAGRAEELRRTSPPAPGRWSGSSSTRRSSPRPRGGPTSPTRAASTARPGSSRT